MPGTSLVELLLVALSGAIGALILRSAFKVALALRVRRKPRATHLCATSGTKPGEFRHCYGHAVDDDEDVKKNKNKKSTRGRAWKHTWDKLPPPPGTHVIGEHTLYGPYINDFGMPGTYRVAFRIRGAEIPKTDEPVISLDVVQAAFGTEHTLRLIGQRILRAEDLSDAYREFDIVCYASGTDIYEYRAAVLPDAKAVKGKTSEIFFDCVTVYAYPPIWDSI